MIAMRGSSVFAASSKVIQSYMILGFSVRPRSLPLRSPLRQENPLRAPFSCQSFSQSDSRGNAPRSSVLSPRDTPNSFPALQERILGQVLDAKSPPSEKAVLLALQECQSYATSQLQTSLNASSGSTPTTALLSLDEGRIVQAVQQSQTPLSSLPLSRSLPGLSATGKLVGPSETVPSKPSLSNFEPLTDLAYKIVSHPDVFITIPILTSYISLQSLIRDPSPIPAVFSLYANKPFTPPGSSVPVRPRPSQIKYAIPSDIASAALDAAIEAKDMSVCLDIIDTSYCAPAFRQARLVRKASPAIFAGCLAPATIYTLADIMAGYQDEVDHSIAMKYAFAGIFAYVFFTGSLGMVALLTSNDQMVRVTWIAGTPLIHRWLREEERAALDKVAQAWGFADPNKRGFEEGDEWELLREVAARKGMYLDNPALMEGMQ